MRKISIGLFQKKMHWRHGPLRMPSQLLGILFAEDDTVFAI